ncbi:MAG: oligosaccharide flippase family protein, partial [Clostridia bacterium]|nr:oligosaccharide flippase family protein [Clostridia bacterium]
SSALASNLIMGLVLLIPMVAIVVFLDKFMEVPINTESAIKTLFALVFSSALINIVASVFGIATFAKNRIDLRSLRELVTAGLRLLLYLVLYNILTPSIIYIGVVTLVVAIVNILFQVSYTKRLLPEIEISRRNVSSKHTKELLSSSCWSAINTFGNTLLVGMTLILSNMLYGAEASGTFSIVNTVPQFINGVISMLVGVFFPIITYKYAQNDSKGLINEIKNAQALVGTLGCAVLAVFSVLAKDFFDLWVPGEDSEYLAVLSFVSVLPHFIISSMWSLTNLNIVMNKVKAPAVFTLCCGILNLILTYVTCSIFDAPLIVLPLISTVLQIIWIGIFIPIYATYNLKVEWYIFYPALIKAVVSTIIVMCSVSIVKNIFVIDNWFGFLLCGAVSGIYALVVFGVIMIGPKKIIYLLKRFVKR